MNHYFHNFHTIYKAEILFRSSMESLADFVMKSTSKKHVQRTRMHVIAYCHITNGEFIIFIYIFILLYFIYYIKHFQTFFCKIIEWMQSFELFFFEGFYLFFMIFHVHCYFKIKV